MKELVQQLGYVLDPANNIWISPDYKGIAYNDGDEIETRIASIIKQAVDISVLSIELRQHCTDWPSLYHLSGTRANVMRPFEAFIKGDILEIGAGCGAITRYLGECGANVLALEGSPRRAAIARSRTLDLENITVLAEKFDQFQCDQQFDVITLIGVLEYANLFTTGENPALVMLERVRSLLKPSGHLILAIENQLGLKYFAGSPEDHLGQPMFGIEGRYRKDQPQTFGRKVLADMLSQAGFLKSDFLAPFPDYKLPVSIVTESGFSNTHFDASALAWQSARRDPQLPEYCNFSLELAWPEIFKNELALDVSNSFLIIASPNSEQMINTEVLAYHYSSGRVPAYCKETLFRCDVGESIRVDYQPLSVCQNIDHYQEKLPIQFRCPDSQKYVFGKSLSIEFIRILTMDGWTFDQVAQLIQRYLAIVSTFSGIAELVSPYTELDGEFFDAIPQNILVRQDGGYALIDKEWQTSKPIEVGHLLFRALLLLHDSISQFGGPATGKNLTRYEFVDGVFDAAGLKLKEEDFDRYIALEAEIQQCVTGFAAESFLSWEKDRDLPILNLNKALAERESQIVGLNDVVAIRDRQIADLNDVVSVRDRQVADLNDVVAIRDKQIADLNDVVAIRDKQIADLNDVVAIRDKQIADLNDVVAIRDKQIVDLNNVVNSCFAQIGASNQSIAELGQVNTLLSEQVSDLKRRAIDFENSTSWKITRPLRSVSLIFKKNARPKI